MWADELKLAISEAAEHLSLYQLTIEEGTPFFGLHAAGKLKTPDEAVARALYDVTQEVCTQYGLPSYEISNHARSLSVNTISSTGAAWNMPASSRRSMAASRYDGTSNAIATESVPKPGDAREAFSMGVVTDDLLNSEERADEFR